MTVLAIEPRRWIQGVFHVPGSKSLANRALVCAACADGDSVIQNASDSDDTALMANGLNQLGVLVRRVGDEIIVGGKGGRLFAPKFPIPVGNAGTTLRFLISLAALAEGRTVFEGSDRMAERPIEDLLGALQGQGILAARHPVVARYEISGGSLRGGALSIRGDQSSQFLSSVLLVAPYAADDLVLTVEGPLASASYVDLTVDVMRIFGAQVERDSSAGVYRVSCRHRYVPSRYRVETDASGATYGMAAAAIAGGRVRIPGLSPATHQADIRMADILEKMGCVCSEEDGSMTLRCAGSLRGVDVDMNLLPDAVPTLAVVALFAEGQTRIRNVAHLRHKESDRLGCLESELRKVGAQVVVDEGGLVITPAPLSGALLDTHNDHRLAMAFALVGLRVSGVSITDPGCVAKSFPHFWEEFEKLR